jgi:hypothetical protein
MNLLSSLQLRTQKAIGKKSLRIIHCNATKDAREHEAPKRYLCQALKVKP